MLVKDQKIQIVQFRNIQIPWVLHQLQFSPRFRYSKTVIHCQHLYSQNLMLLLVIKLRRFEENVGIYFGIFKPCVNIQSGDKATEDYITRFLLYH